ncbi:OLC1v1015775C1 [Oldenlandia corymbosa var. corymbosa]|uniref:OLC1v1015775C1 n=1 Tax=Oldenlandia corymbosa var. corymbosa TaxID=529605 RepID=A0AAV1E6Y8_OLDCO|nr:OLC1v1015775C1 [Oldenlandia corymbosa var. corymbosa]
MGDFNNILKPEEKLGGKPVLLQDFEEFQWSMEECGLRDLTQKGKMFTWCNQRVGIERIYAKLDRALVNGEWIHQYAKSIATVLIEGVSDHSPLEVQFQVQMQKRRTAFRFFNMWCLSTDFQRTVERSWAEKVEGTCMYQLCQKLKRLKHLLKQLNRIQFADIVEKANREEMQLEVMQQKLSLDPGDADFASFWEVEAKNDASWQWKQILKVRDQRKLGVVGSRWLASSNGKYTVKSGYAWFAGNETKFRDLQSIWSRMNVPKHSFIAWLAWKKRLWTKDRLTSMHMAVNDQRCLLCRLQPETIEHLFFQCTFAAVVLEKLVQWLGCRKIAASEARWRMQILNMWKGQKINRRLLWAVIAACTYHLWEERNRRLFQQLERSPEQITLLIKDEMRGRFLYCHKRKNRPAAKINL